MRSFVNVAVLSIAFATAGCNADASAANERFLGALAREDFDAAFAELHPEARADIPDAATLRARMTSSGMKLKAWSGTCASTGSLFTKGYNVEVQLRGGAKRPLLVGVMPDLKQKCHGPALLVTKQDSAAPNAPWKVRSLYY